jgi:hypothetical protein
MRAKGMKLRDIRAAIDEKWGKRGPATKTPFPPTGV